MTCSTMQWLNLTVTNGAAIGFILPANQEGA